MADMIAVRNGSGLVELAACRKLHDLAKKVSHGHAIVELGAHRGRSTGWLASGAVSSHVWSVDPWSDLANDAVDDGYAEVEPAYRNGSYVGARAEFDAHIAACRLTGKVTPIQSTSLDVASTWSGPPVGLLFHDATHSYVSVRDDLLAWLPHLAARCVVALHDLGHPKFGVESAAFDVLSRHEFDWRGRQRLLWKKDPKRRGLLVVAR